MLEQALTGAALGLGLGAVFFAGLWATVKRLPAARSPRLLALGSYVVRMALACAVFVLAGRLGGPCLAAACAAFLAVRLAVQLRLAPWRTAGQGERA